jgi:hypothetical protein
MSRTTKILVAVLALVLIVPIVALLGAGLG